MFNSALKVCRKNAKVTDNSENDQKLWFVFLDEVYNIWMDIQKLIKDNEHKDNSAKITKLKSISNIFNEFITKLLESMGECVSLPHILTSIVESHGELEIASFKSFFSSMITTYFYQEKVMETAKGIIGMEVGKEFRKLNYYLSRGAILKHTYCSKCGKLIEYNLEENAIAFPCGHIYHSKCISDSDVCFICVVYVKSNLKIIIENIILEELMKKPDKQKGPRKKSKDIKKVSFNHKKEEKDDKIDSEDETLNSKNKFEHYLNRKIGRASCRERVSSPV